MQQTLQIGLHYILNKIPIYWQIAEKWYDTHT